MHLLPVLFFAALISTSLAAPHRNGQNTGSRGDRTSTAIAVATTAAVAAGAGAAAVTAGGKEVENANKIDLAGVFDTAIALAGGDVQQDVLFTKSAVGALEVEFANAAGRTLTVSENKTPAAPPAGFTALEPSSFKINLAEGADGLTLQKVDYIIDPASAAIVGLDISKGQIGKLCSETNTFVIDPALGELEFEAEENELTLTVKNINGEWGIFIPTNVVAANAAVAKGGEGVDENEVAGVFNTAIATPGGHLKTDILFTANAAGSLEVEVNATAANAITVVTGNPTGKAPTGFLFVDPQSFKIATASVTAAADVVKVDYIFSAAVLAAVDPTKGRIGKLDAAKNEFVIDGIGEFEFEAEENEWTLTVADLNGEWAVLIPQAAVL